MTASKIFSKQDVIKRNWEREKNFAIRNSAVQRCDEKSIGVLDVSPSGSSLLQGLYNALKKEMPSHFSICRIYHIVTGPGERSIRGVECHGCYVKVTKQELGEHDVFNWRENNSSSVRAIVGALKCQFGLPVNDYDSTNSNLENRTAAIDKN